jgi:hypothetical protein
MSWDVTDTFSRRRAPAPKAWRRSSGLRGCARPGGPDPTRTPSAVVMRSLALACDDDGTCALHGHVDDATVAALEPVRASVASPSSSRAEGETTCSQIVLTCTSATASWRRTVLGSLDPPLAQRSRSVPARQRPSSRHAGRGLCAPSRSDGRREQWVEALRTGTMGLRNGARARRVAHAPHPWRGPRRRYRWTLRR